MNAAARMARRIARWPRWRRYAAAVGLVAAATLSRLALSPLLGDHHRLVFYIAAALVAGLFLDTGSSLLVLVLGGAAAIFLVPRFGGLDVRQPSDIAGLVLYLLLGGLLCALGERMHRAMDEAQNSRRGLERALEAQRRAEEEYRVAFELGVIGQAQTDARTGRFIHVNSSFCRMTGYTREELLQKTYLDITHPEDRAPDAEFYRQVKDREIDSLVIDKRYVRKDGGVVCVRLAAAPVRDAAGEVRWMVATLEDITLQKEAERELKESRARFARLAAAVPAFVWTARPDGSVDYFNERWERYTGMPAAKTLGWGWLDALHPEDRSRCQISWGERARQGDPWECQSRFRSAGGEYRWFASRAEPLRDESGAITAWFGTSVDIHDAKLAQERLERSARELARSNADLENFAHIAAHDLKEPLRGIRLTVGFLAEDAAGKLDERERASLDALDRLATRMHELLDAMLEYSRVGRSGVSLHEEDTGRIAREALHDLEARVQQDHARVEVRGPLPKARCDPALLRTVFANLVSNGLKYNTSTPKIVEVGTLGEAGAPGGEGAAPSGPDARRAPVFYVRDNGIGIPRDQADQVFRMFKRLHSRGSYGGGTGAGLAIVQRIVERHGGHIWLESEPGRGSTFYFTLGEREPEAAIPLPLRPARESIPGRAPGEPAAPRRDETAHARAESAPPRCRPGGPETDEARG